MRGRLSLAVLVICFVPLSGVWALEVDSKLPPYKPVSGVSGNLKAVGSDTLNNLMTLWSEGFREIYPSVTVSVEGKGSSTAPPALIEGTAQFGPMSREMKSKEEEAFEKKFGYPPSRVRVAVDALAVFVNKDNPVECLTLEQLDAAFSKGRRRGHAKDATTWGDLGLTGEWSDKPVSLYGRNSASGTYGYFKKIVLANGDYKDSVKEQPGSSAVVQAVASDRYGIGYSGVGYKTADVKVVPLARKEGECIEATAENAYAGDYPLARFLYIYFNSIPGQPLSPLMAEFIKYVVSLHGQKTVIKDGFYPVSAELAGRDLRTAGLENESDSRRYLRKARDPNTGDQAW